MELICKQTYCIVTDPMKMINELNQIADECTQHGLEFERGFLGMVTLKFPKGEVHYVPGEGKITEMIFIY